ncbi:endonuclease/exonuclease/phosphatase family protein [Desulfobacula sp.]
MGFKNNSPFPKFFLIGISFIFLAILFLFSGTAVNNYYHIQTPAPGRVIESNPGFSQETISPESINILCWNVYKGKRDGWLNDFNTLSKDMDIILIQEARRNGKEQGGFGITGMGWNFAQSFSYHKKLIFSTGVMTLSKACPVFVSYLLTSSREPLTHTPKISLLSLYSLTGTPKKLLVINTHGINFVKSSDFASQMMDIEKKIKRHRGPVIFAGDFNTWNKKRVSILSKIMNRSEMKEVLFHPDTRTRRFRHVLDHVFYRGLKLKQAKVFNAITSSDHKAMGIEFYLPANP